MEPSDPLIDGLTQRAREVLRPLTPDGPYALVDFPAHANVGDSAIWAGELAYFERSAPQPPAYVSALFNFSAEDLRRRCPEGPIFIHGGGNFGDVWPHHQAFRLKILETFPDRPIVQLPQSIHFSDPAARDRTARAIERHGRVTLLVRDRESFDLATKTFACDVRLCPDMAFFLGRAARLRPAELDVLCLLRTDSERADLQPPPSDGASVAVADWLQEPRLSVRAARALGAAEATMRGGLDHARYGDFRAAAKARVRRGYGLLSRGRTIVTDRLHTHILSLLLGIPHAVLDNSYGKISRFMTCWTEVSPLVRRCTTPEEAMAWARGQVGGVA